MMATSQTKMQVSRQPQIRIFGHLAALFPFLGFYLVRLWYSVSAVYVIEKDNYWITSPDWWKRLGFSDNAAMLAGLLPGIISGLYGLLAIGLSRYSRSKLLIFEGVWACCAAFPLCLYWMIITF